MIYKENLRFAHLDTTDIAALEVALATATSENLSLQHDILGLQVGSKLGSFISCLGNAKLGRRNSCLVEDAVADMFVDIEIPYRLFVEAARAGQDLQSTRGQSLSAMFSLAYQV